MMDGRIGVIKEALHRSGFQHVAVMRCNFWRINCTD
jgi:delta-aminolevulinic acid dehydratase/porphobilinogen synthase